MKYNPSTLLPVKSKFQSPLGFSVATNSREDWVSQYLVLSFSNQFLSHKGLSKKQFGILSFSFFLGICYYTTYIKLMYKYLFKNNTPGSHSWPTWSESLGMEIQEMIFYITSQVILKLTNI